MNPKNRDVQFGKRNKGKRFKKPTPVTNLMVPTSVISSPGVCGWLPIFAQLTAQMMTAKLWLLLLLQRSDPNDDNGPSTDPIPLIH